VSRACDVGGCESDADGTVYEPIEQPRRKLRLCRKHGHDLIDRDPTDAVRKKLAKKLGISAQRG
jgi:hypothetical protein